MTAEQVAERLQGMCLLSLATVPNLRAAWMASAEGKRFVAPSSQRWGEASVAAGADPNAADEATHYTSSFYTG